MVAFMCDSQWQPEAQVPGWLQEYPHVLSVCLSIRALSEQEEEQVYKWRVLHS